MIENSPESPPISANKRPTDYHRPWDTETPISTKFHTMNITGSRALLIK